MDFFSWGTKPCLVTEKDGAWVPLNPEAPECSAENLAKGNIQHTGDVTYPWHERLQTRLTDLGCSESVARAAVYSGFSLSVLGAAYVAIKIADRLLRTPERASWRDTFHKVINWTVLVAATVATAILVIKTGIFLSPQGIFCGIWLAAASVAALNCYMRDSAKPNWIRW
jgi:hypothetical protein